MAVCTACEQEMTEAVGCTVEEIPGRGPRIRYGDESGEPFASDPCHDCGAPKGTYHHPFCDAEECPRCGGQLISCACK